MKNENRNSNTEMEKPSVVMAQQFWPKPCTNKSCFAIPIDNGAFPHEDKYDWENNGRGDWHIVPGLRTETSV